MTDTYTLAIKAMRDRVSAAVDLPVILPNDHQEKPESYIELWPHFGKGEQLGYSLNVVREESIGFLELKLAVPRNSGIGTASVLIDRLEPVFTGARDGCICWRGTESFFDLDEQNDSHYTVPLNIYFEWIRHKRRL